MIKLVYLSVDGFRKSKQFKRLAGARKYAQEMVGKHPEIGSFYAVSSDGVGTIRNVSGCRLADLFGDVNNQVEHRPQGGEATYDDLPSDDESWRRSIFD